MEEDETGFYGGTAEGWIFSADESDNDFEEEPENLHCLYLPDEQQILATIYRRRCSGDFRCGCGSDITETLNTVLHFMGAESYR